MSDPADGRVTVAWHALSVADALARLRSSPDGLDDAAARSRLAEWGPNSLPRASPRAWRRILLALAAFIWSQQRSADPARAVTLSFMTLALAQIFHLGNARSGRHSCRCRPYRR